MSKRKPPRPGACCVCGRRFLVRTGPVPATCPKHRGHKAYVASAYRHIEKPPEAMLSCPARLARIALYARRAALKLPLFEERKP